jgi:hypothetical protein
MLIPGKETYWKDKFLERNRKEKAASQTRLTFDMHTRLRNK